AMTRARQSLYLNYFKRDEDANPAQPYAPLLALDVQPTKLKTANKAAVLVSEYEERWLMRSNSLQTTELTPYLEDQLKNYRLSVTHLNNFLDLSLGGPAYFLEQNLLHFPVAKSPMALYGSAVHMALSRAHSQVLSGKKLGPERIIR